MNNGEQFEESFLSVRICSKKVIFLKKQRGMRRGKSDVFEESLFDLIV